MMWISLLLIVSPALVFGATFEETRQVVDSTGKEFECSYKLTYDTKANVNKKKSSVTCIPNTAGTTVTETFVIEEIGKSVSVKHSIKKGKEKVSAITTEDYVAPVVPAPAGSAEDMTCNCRMSPDSMSGFLSSVRTAVPAVVNRQLLGGGLFSNLVNNVPAPAPASAGLDLASLLGGGSNDFAAQLAMQVAQQQVNDFINNGGAEEALTGMVESGQLEEMLTSFVESGQAETMVGQMMENVDIETMMGKMMENMDTEAMMGKIMENMDMEAMMSEMVGSLEQQMEENMQNGGWEEMMAGGPLGEMMQSMDVSGGLEELMGNMEGGLLGPEMLSQLGNMEMNMKCSCSPVA